MFRILLLTPLLLSSFAVLAQPQQDIYNRAIDEINCATVKTLLISYDRPVAARMIQTCSYDNIARALDKVQENTIKGYKKLIVETAQTINGYKSKVANPAEYSLYESALEEAQALALKRYEDVCSKNKGSNTTVCANMEQKALKLQSELNGIVSTALPKIAKQTYGGEKAATTTEKTAATNSENANVKKPIEEIPRKEYSNGAQPEISNSSNGGSSNFWTLLHAAIILGLIAAVAWLFKENRELKEKMDDITMLLKVLNQKK